MLFENEPLLKELKKDYWGTWLNVQRTDWPKVVVGDKLGMTRYLLREIDLAARCRDCDWQISKRTEGLGLLLPDAQAYRAIASILAVQARHQIFQGQFEEAARTLQTGLALGVLVQRVFRGSFRLVLTLRDR